MEGGSGLGRKGFGNLSKIFRVSVVLGVAGRVVRVGGY